jgi:hypothetical protein
VQGILKNIFLSNNCNICLSFQSGLLLSNNPVLQNTELLILNHIVSDVYKHAQNRSADTLAFFKNDICPIIQQMPVDSYILINDVNSCFIMREEIEKWTNLVDRVFNIIERRTDRDSVFFGSDVVSQSAYVILKRN